VGVYIFHVLESFDPLLMRPITANNLSLNSIVIERIMLE
jgi:hypothetical protein